MGEQKMQKTESTFSWWHHPSRSKGDAFASEADKGSESSCQPHRAEPPPSPVLSLLHPFIILSFHLCIYSFLHSALFCTCFVNFCSLSLARSIYRSLYLCLLALCVCIDFMAVHAPYLSPSVMEGVRWSLCQIKSKSLSPLPLASPQQAQPSSALNSGVCEMSFCAPIVNPVPPPTPTLTHQHTLCS